LAGPTTYILVTMTSQAKQRVVRVHLIDGTCKSFAIDVSATVDQLRTMVMEKIQLVEMSSFALFERKDDCERCLDPEEKPCELMNEWVNAEKKKDGQEPRIIFKKKIFLRDDDREMKDSVAKHFLYIQALHSVIESEYPMNAEDAINLAGLQVQINYGDHNATTHVVGFLTQNLHNFIPKNLFPVKTAKEWETLIFKAHQKITGKTAEDAKTEYLDIVKLNSYYGTTFFPPCKPLTKVKLPSKVVIGVNAEGILLLKAKDKELLSAHPFTEVVSWSSSPSTFTFEFGTQTDAVKYSFETKQGMIIASTIQTYIDILVQMLKNGESDDEESNSNSTD